MRVASSLLALLSLAGGALASDASSQNSSAVPWSHLSISPEGRYLYRTSSGEPFFWQADTAWELFHRLNRTDIDDYLRDRASKGFNVVQAVVLSELNGTTFPNFYGDLALHDGDPTQPNEAYFEHVDWTVRRAADYGILIALVPTWGRWVNCGWHNGTIIFNETSAETYGRFIGERYPGLPKIIGADSNGFWACNASVAQDAFRKDPSLDPTTLLGPVTDTRAVWARMADAFAASESEAGFTPFVTWHPTNMWVSIPETSLPYGHNYLNGSLGTLSMDAIQSGHNIYDNTTVDTYFTALSGWNSTTNYELITNMRAEFDGPVIDLENHYEGAYVGFNTSRPLWNASHVRHGFYNAYLSGSAGFTYGANAIWQMYAPKEQLAREELYYPPIIEQPANESWRDALAYPGATQSGYVKRLFAGLTKDDMESMSPNRTFILSPDGGEDVLQFEANRYIAGLAAASQYWVYTGYGDSFDLDLDALAGHFNASNASAILRWWDPREGVYLNETSAAPVISLSGRQAFVPPTSGSVDDDWVLHVKAA